MQIAACNRWETGDSAGPLTGPADPERFPKAHPQPLETALAAPSALPPTALAVSQIMAVDEIIETEGKITSVLAGTMFRVELANQHVARVIGWPLMLRYRTARHRQPPVIGCEELTLLVMASRLGYAPTHL